MLFYKKMKKVLVLFLFSFCLKFSFSQVFGRADEGTKYSAERVIDPEYGITMYEKLNPQIGGDSSRSTSKGYAAQGWEEDYYLSGALLHKGYYEDGQLTSYKNYYENGNVERSFKIIDFKRCGMETFYSDGKLKSTTIYFGGNVLKGTDYYQNGQIEYEIENEKNMKYIIYRRSYTEDGKPQEIFECTNEKKQLFYQKEYHENGNLKEEGALKFNPYKMDYMKDGNWKVYDKNGKYIKTEKYAYGDRLKE